MKPRFSMAAVLCGTLILPAGMAHAGDVEAGKGLFASKGCIACHGPRAEGMAAFPKLAGLPADDIVTALKAYRAGETRGKMTVVMAPNAKTLSDIEIADLAAYLSDIR